MWDQNKKMKDKRNSTQINRDPTSEGLRWRRTSKRDHDLLHMRPNTIHVMDREADNYNLFSVLVQNKMRFVIRVRSNRKLLSGPSLKLFENLRNTPPKCIRDI